MREEICIFAQRMYNKTVWIMKKLTFAILAMVLTMPVMAQQNTRYSSSTRTTTTKKQYTSYAQEYNIYYGLRLGLSVTTINSDDDRLDGGSSQAGVNIGAIIGFGLSNEYPIYLETGLFYVEKGGKGRYQDKKVTYDLNYLELPILVKYKFDIDGDFGIHPFAGGYLACGVGGKVKDYEGVLNDEGKERMTYSSFSDDYFQRFDAGIRIGCGFEYQMIYAELSYEFGLVNVSHSEFDSSHNGCLYINVGVNF